MSLKYFSAAPMTLVLWTCINFGTSWPLFENTTAAAAAVAAAAVLPMEYSKSSMVTSVSPAAAKSNDSKKQIVRSTENNKKSLGSFGGVNFHRLPPSPANLLKPDRFQFYTYNERGDMITKQMTMQEIQALIAGGGPGHSNTEIQEPQKVEDILTGGKKVMDIVEKVQNVLKSAMGKPATLTGSLPTVPEKANVEWSNILPAILAGDKYGDKFEETHYVGETTSKPASTFATVLNPNSISEILKANATGAAVPLESTIESTVRNDAAVEQTDEMLHQTQEISSTIVSQTTTVSPAEKLMIPVAVITAEQSAQITQRVTQSPVFQKITEIVSLENGSDENAVYNEKHRHTSTTVTRVETTKIATMPAPTTTTTTTIATDTSPLFLEFTPKESNDNITEVVTSTASDSKNESLIIEQLDRRNVSLPIETKIKPIADTSLNGDKVWQIFDKGSKPDSESGLTSSSASTSTSTSTSMSESNKIQMLVTNGTFATSPSHSSATITITTDKFATVLPTEWSTTVHYAPPFTSPSDYFDSRKTAKPLSMELANSLSSMINQISETVPSVLPISPEFESMININYENYESDDNQTEVNNVSEISTNTAPIIRITKFPVISKEKVGNVNNTFEEQVQTTTSNATNNKLQLDEQQIFPTTTSLSIRETTNYSDISLTTIPSVSESSLGSTKATMIITTTTTTATTPTNTNEIRKDTVVNDSTVISTVASDRINSSAVALESTEETITASPLESLETTLEVSSKINSINANVVNWSKPIAIVDKILATLPTEVNIAVTEPLTLPSILPENSSANTLASGLIAGFELFGSTITTLSYAEKFNSTDSSFDSKISSGSSKADVPSTTEESSTSSNEADQLIVPTTNKQQSSNSTRLSNLQKETETEMETLGQTTDRTRPVTRPTTEYSEREIESSSDAWKYTRINGSSIDEITTTSIIGTDENVISSKLTDVFNEHASSVVASDDTTDAFRETNSAEFSGNSLIVSNPVTANGWSDPPISNLENTFNTNSTESTVSTIETVFEGAPTTKDSIALTRINNVTQTPPSTKRTEVETVETNTSETILSSSSGNLTETEVRPLQKQHSEEQQIYNAASPSLTDNAISEGSSSKETFERQRNRTTPIGQSWNAVNATIAASNITELSSVAVTKPTKTIVRTEIRTPTTMANTSKNESGIGAFNSIESNESKNQTTKKEPNLLIVPHELQHTKEKNDFDRLISSKPNNGTNNDSEHMWQRISLHQTTPMIISFSSSSSSFSSDSLSTKEPITESTTRFESKLSKTNIEQPSSMLETQSTTSTTASTVSLNASKNIGGLDISTRNASNDIVHFSRLCNEIAFKFWTAANNGLSGGRSLVVSPFGMISLLAMIFLGARGSTSDQMNEVLGLDNVATFNPHLIFQNVTDTVSLARHQGIANAAFVRELFADKAKLRKLLPFYKEQAQQFYEGLVAEVNFATISDLARRRTNLLIRKQTGGRIKDFVKNNAIPLRSPLAAISANVFQTDCNGSLASATGRDGELYFAVSSTHRLRKLVPVPATVWRSNVLAGYEPNLDATAIAVGGIGQLVSTIFLLPGQQGHVAPGDTLDRLEQRLVRSAFRDGAWNKLLNVLIPRAGLELQIPKFTHRSVVNATAALKTMGLDQLFSTRADFKGINGIGNRLFLSDVLQMNLFGTCGDENIANGRHHVEIYPASPSFRNSRYDEPRNAEQSVADGLTEWTNDELSSRDYRKIPTVETTTINVERSKDKPRLKLDQPFLYFVRHNPTGLILHMGRFNPRLL